MKKEMQVAKEAKLSTETRFTEVSAQLFNVEKALAAEQASLADKISGSETTANNVSHQNALLLRQVATLTEELKSVTGELKSAQKLHVAVSDTDAESKDDAAPSSAADIGGSVGEFSVLLKLES